LVATDLTIDLITGDGHEATDGGHNTLARIAGADRMDARGGPTTSTGARAVTP
jgi:hypothetical protein